MSLLNKRKDDCELVETRVKEMGVRPFFKRFAHNGVDGPNIAAVYSDRGYGVRPPGQEQTG